jgi:hypothetical protein
MGGKLEPGKEYKFTLGVSLASNPSRQGDEMSGYFIPEEGETPDFVREEIMALYLRENHHVSCRKMYSARLSYH